MSETAFALDDTGKIDLNGIYDQTDPRSYYQTLSQLDYRIPAAAEPVFRTVIAAWRAQHGSSTTLLDVGCSYGVNAAILRLGCDLSELFDHYRSIDSAMTSTELLARDRQFFGAQRSGPDLTVVGLDTAANAVSYACRAGIMEDGLVADLEVRDPTPSQSALLGDVDVVISTGAIGYVGEATFTRIIDSAQRPPWFALFALRMFPIDAIAETLKQRGYRFFRLEGKTFRQRRFATRAEASEVLANLDGSGIDATGREEDGWLHAEFFFAHPRDEAVCAPLNRLVEI